MQNESVYIRLRLIRTSFPKVIKYILPQNTKHLTSHHINTSGPSVFAKARRLDSKKFADAEAEFESVMIRVYVDHLIRGG